MTGGIFTLLAVDEVREIIGYRSFKGTLFLFCYPAFTTGALSKGADLSKRYL
jgi:hypothetical protein